MPFKSGGLQLATGKLYRTFTVVNHNFLLYLIAQCKGVAFRFPPFWSTMAPLEMKYLKHNIYITRYLEKITMSGVEKFRNED